MYEGAREYLAQVVPWPQPGEQAYVNLHWTFDPGPGKPLREPGKYPWSGRAVSSLDEAISTLTYWGNKGGTRDVYLCMSMQSYAELQPAKGRGRPQLKAVRLADNAISLKSFFLDIDVKAPQLDEHGNPKPIQKGYATFEEAITELTKFITTLGLPSPTMVINSGGGIHVYWTLDRALTPAEWLPYAHALAEATKALGLRCDTQCTVDTARVLRMPGTFNRKTEPPRHVTVVSNRPDNIYSLSRIAQCIETYKNYVAPKVLAGLDPNLFPPRTPILGTSALASNVDQASPVVDLDRVLPQCAFLRNAVATGGALLDNPLWNLTTLTAVFCKDGRVQAHRLADKHATYTKDATDTLYERKVSDKENKGLGWPSCQALSANGARDCQACTHFGKGKSPLNFEVQSAPVQTPPNGGPVQGNAPASAGGFGAASSITAGSATLVVAGQQHTNTDLPTNHSRSATGVISRGVVQEDGTTLFIPISDYPMYDPWIQGPKPYILHFTSIVEKGRVAQLDLPLEIAGGMEMRKHLQSQGLMLKIDAKKTSEFFVAWIETLQKAKDAVASSPFGWTKKSGATEGFVYGGQLWTPSGSSPSALADGVISRQYTPSGTLQPWVDAAKLVTSQGRPALEAILASAFAAPLVMFTGHLGVLMSAFSQESGIGKSTALKIAQAVWGDPVTAVQSLSDTSNSVMGKIGEIRNLPVYWDELKTEEDTKKFVNITFQMGQGKEKSRMTSSAKQREPGRWNTLLVSCSNDSLLDYVTQHTSTTTAGLYRVFEFTVPKAAHNAPGRIDTSDASVIVSKLHDNFGIVGLEYAKYLGVHHNRIELEVGDFARALNAEVSSNNEERFWIATISCICVGAKYSNQLGFTAIDEPALKGFLLGVLTKMRGEVSAQPVDMKNSLHVSNVLQQFLSAMRQRHTLVTNKIHIAKGKPPTNAIKVLTVDPSKLDYIAIHYGQDDKLMRISSYQLGEWLKSKQLSRHIFIEALSDRFGMQKVVGRIGSGTHLAGGTEYLLQLDLQGHTEINFIDEA